MASAAQDVAADVAAQQAAAMAESGAIWHRVPGWPYGAGGVDVDGAPPPAYAPPTNGELLRGLMRVDALLARPLVAELHTLYLLCLPDATFKRAFAEAFADLYLSLAVQYASRRPHQRAPPSR